MLQQITNKTPRVCPSDGSLTLTIAPDLSRVDELRPDETTEVLSFLTIRPVHTVVMTSFINDNGIQSHLNRGRFYGYRNVAGQLEGVALIGHTTLVEARSDEALEALAFTARHAETPIHLIMSSGNSAETFWGHLMGGRREPRLTCTEALFETSFPFAIQQSEWKIENATMGDLLPVGEAQAEVAFIESGVDPLESDREGFLRRVARRIEQDRVFVVRKNGRMIFKADIIAETDEAIYLEGVYVAHEFRGRGIGAECLAKLVLQLLDRVQNICLLSNVEFEKAHKTFLKAGFRNTDHCTTIFA